MTENDRAAMDRRAFLRRMGAAGVATAWAAPIVQTVAATPAFAQTAGQSPEVQDCFKSTPNADGNSCMSVCTATCESAGFTAGNQAGEACNGVDPDPCNPLGDGPCQFYCPSGQGGDNPCCNPGLCVAGNFTCELVPCAQSRDGSAVVATYIGPTSGC